MGNLCGQGITPPMMCEMCSEDCMNNAEDIGDCRVNLVTLTDGIPWTEITEMQRNSKERILLSNITYGLWKHSDGKENKC